MTRYLILTLVLSFLVTETAEILWALLFRIRKSDLPVVFLANLLTNPPYVLTVLICRMYVRIDRLPVLQAVLEAGIILIEFLIYRKSVRTCRHPFLLSLTANFFSILCGMLVSRFLSNSLIL